MKAQVRKQKIINFQVRMEEKLKDDAEAIALESGFDSLAAATRVLLTALATGKLDIGIVSPQFSPEQIKKWDAMALEAEKDYRFGKYYSFNSARDLDLYLSDNESNYNGKIPKNSRYPRKTA